MTTKTTVKPMTAEAFVETVKELGKEFRGFGTLTTMREVKPSEIKGGKGSGYAGRIQKFSRFQVVLNPTYTNAVNNQRGRETEVGEYMEEFKPEPRRWGKRLEGTSLVENKGKFYLEVQVLRSFETQWFLDGQPVQSEDVKPLLHQRKGESKKQQTEKAVILRDYGVNTIRTLKYTTPEGVATTLELV